MKTIAIIFLSLFSMAALAEEPEPATPETEVTIRHGGDRTLYEYRANGVLYAIKVEPDEAPAYFLVDPNGEGNYIRVEKTRILIPSWVIKEW